MINRSETAKLKLFKHDDPPNNTNKFDVEKALNENWDKIDEAIGENKEKIQENTITAKQIIKIDTLILAETEYTLPCKYKVGNNSLIIHWENVLLEEGEEGNYMEIGEPGSTSNKIKFGWDIEPGETLIIEVRGVVEDE